MSENESSTGAAPLSRFATSPLLIVALVLLLIGGMVAARLSGNVWLQVVMLGIVEGLTEFLPISSTAHLLITSDLIAFQHSIDGTFEVFIQLGAVLAVVGFYARDLLAQARAIPTSAETRRFWLGIIIAFLPAVVVGILLRDWVKAVLFENNSVIALSLIIGGIIFIVVENLPQRTITASELSHISFRQAFATGCAQVLALVPGVSRSGASIVGGMFAGLNRSTATAFSFYLAIPTLGGATVLDLLLSIDKLDADDLGRLLLGMVISGIVAWLSIGWLLRYVASNSFVPFGIYRILAGIVILIMVATGQL